jgi:ribokinase
MSFDIIVVGSLHMDIMVSAPDRPRRGETLAGDSWRLKPGGKGGNQAVEAALAGGRTAMVGAVGDDDFGRQLLQNLRDSGVDNSRVGVRTGAGSGMSVAIVDSEGDYGAVIVSGANLLLDDLSLDNADSLFRGAHWLLLQQELPDAANVAAARKARSHGVRTILNAAPSRAFPDGLKGLVDILVVNAIEAEAMRAATVDQLSTGAEAATSLLQFAPAILVTAGPVGDRKSVV